jgi:hypothetical protein
MSAIRLVYVTIRCGEREGQPMDIFDTDAMKADMEREKKAEDSAVGWSVAALNGFLKAAQELGTPVVELDMESDAAEASGIAIGNWPTAEKDGKKVAEYYRIVRDTSWGPAYPAEDGNGLTMTLDGRIFLKRNVSSAEDAAKWICGITANNLDTAKAVFDSALKGQPMAVA